MLVLEDPWSHVSAVLKIACYTNTRSYFFALYARRGRLRIRAIQYPLIRKRAVRKACTAASGTMYVFKRLQRSIGLI